MCELLYAHFPKSDHIRIIVEASDFEIVKINFLEGQDCRSFMSCKFIDNFKAFNKIHYAVSKELRLVHEITVS